MTHSIITNCTSRKRKNGIDPLLPSFVDEFSVKDAVKLWVKGLESAPMKFAPLDLYQGRSISECRLVSRYLSAELFVISAGLGLVSSANLIPNYSLTISEGNGSIQNWLTNQNSNSIDWWTELCLSLGTPEPISSLISNSSSQHKVMIAVPKSYMEMIASDLEKIGSNHHQNLRIFTSIAGSKVVPNSLKSLVMPYDERLEGITQHNGTRSDFPQRALKHFVTHLQAQDLSLEEAKCLVRRSMESSHLKLNPRRLKVTDDLIEELVFKNWQNFGGNGTKLLRFLRDEEKVACEQSRFRGIWRKVMAVQTA
jgi:hypothetical protein